MDTSSPSPYSMEKLVKSIFAAWRALRPLSVRSIFTAWRTLRRPTQEYSPRRCIITQMVDYTDYHNKLCRLYESVKKLVQPTPRGSCSILCSTWQIAVTMMSRYKIKSCTYSGCCLRRQAPDCTGLGFQWYDPGNWSYAVLWSLLFECAKIHDNHTLLSIMRSCNLRWPTQRTSRHHLEWLGDLWELILARCLYDDRLSFVLAEISDCMFWLQFISNYVKDHGVALFDRSQSLSCGYLDAEHWAKGLIKAHLTVKYGETQQSATEFRRWRRDVNLCFV